MTAPLSKGNHKVWHTHINRRSHDPGRSLGQGQEMRLDRNERKRNAQGYWSVIGDVHCLGHSDPVLSLDMAKRDKGSTATSVET